MPLTVTLTPEMEAQLAAEAARAGVAPERLAAGVIARHLRADRRDAAVALLDAEADPTEQRETGKALDQLAGIDPLDIRARMEELKLLRHGWLDGKGLASPPPALDWIAASFEERYPDDLRLPYLFPTPTGRVLAEWSLAPWSLSLEIDPVTKRGEWHALNLDTDQEDEKDLDLAPVGDWEWLADKIRSAGGVAE